MPKITFKTWAFYEQSLQYGSQAKTWKSDNENPIYKYIPSRGLPEGSSIPPHTVGIFHDDFMSSGFNNTHREDRKLASTQNWKGITQWDTNRKENYLQTFKQEERSIKNPRKKLLQGLENPECWRKEWGFWTYFPHSDIFTDKARRS